MKKLFSIFAIAFALMLAGATFTSCEKKSKTASEAVEVKDSVNSHVDSTNHP